MLDREHLKALFNKAKNNAALAQPKDSDAIIIADKSYCIYHAMFSAWSYVKKEFGLEDDPDFDPTTNSDFRESLSKRLNSLIRYAAKTALGASCKLSNVIFATDCSKAAIWRNSIYKDYKLPRRIADTSQRPFSFAPVFKHVEEYVIPLFLEENEGAMDIRADNAEGDDVAAIIIKSLPKEKKKVLIASDRDYLQLADWPGLSIVNGFGKVLNLEDESKAKPLVEAGHVLNAKEFLLKKILMGDKADNIFAVQPRLGEVKAAKMILDKKELQKVLKEDAEANARFELNCKLVDFDYIPERIVEEVKSKLSEFHGLQQSDD